MDLFLSTEGPLDASESLTSPLTSTLKSSQIETFGT